jgi:hypothetical protein
VLAGFNGGLAGRLRDSRINGWMLGAVRRDAGAWPGDQAPALQACGGDEIARGMVSRIVDGRTFVLDDGREVRLAAIEVAPLVAPHDAAARAAAAALSALAGGSFCCSENWWPKALPGSAIVSQALARGICWIGRKRPAKGNLAYGPIRTKRC